MPKAIPIEEEIGKRYGRLAVVTFSHYRQTKWGKRKIYNFACCCGNSFATDIKDVKSGNTKSCGCITGERHGESTSSVEYNAWLYMRTRCLNKNREDWMLYGGRGVKICQRWIDSFSDFLSDVGRRPSPHHSLDRWPDVNGDYEPGNVRWASPDEQANNKRNNRKITFNGETLNLSQWARRVGVGHKTISYRLSQNNWSIERALTTPGVPSMRGRR